MLASRLSSKLPQIARVSSSLTRQALARNYSAMKMAVPSISEHPTSLYAFTEEELMFKDTVARFAREVVQPRVQAMDDAEKMDTEVINAMFENGLMGLETEGEYGGAEASFTAAILAVEELAKVDPSISALCDIHNTLTNTMIRKWGTPEQKEKYLTRLATDTVGSFCISESGAGSDAFALQSRAEDKGDHYVLNGGKMWISNSGEADIFVIFANVDPSKGYKGITAFIVEKEWGVQIAKKEKKLGIRSSSTCVLNFDDVKIPKENVLGKVGDGYKYAIDSLNEGRIGISAQMIGCAQGAFDIAVAYSHERKQFGKPLSSYQAMQHQFAQVAVEIEAARLMTYNACRLKEEGKPFVAEAAMAKFKAAKVAEQATSYAVEWMGGMGFLRETGVEKFYRDSKIGSIYEGTNNMQLETIAKILLPKYK
ncbi:acyl-CoA dehydrogenase NM domain-like protein [Hesseltinella vesiculosa]|uniref:Short/branched chain specific acyl-CoA dehydrogenase, mitochondrial n=1 Tax=Hesseltinella vesiculosa TaxID=101127 RepID=A0A1X2GF15_9FUNG|nr:acyl-CoA dehydrogenase NM domain-like protein [Hesseltinella vesiculosa]